MGEPKPDYVRPLARPPLRPYPVDLAISAWAERPPGQLFVTMAPGQWDALLAEAYDNGAVLLEVGEENRIVAAYYKRKES